MVDVKFDESNGSQVKQIDLDVVGKEKLPCEAIKQMAIGDVRPVETTEEDDPQLQVSTPLQGPAVVQGPENLQNAEASRSGGSAPEQRDSEVQDSNQQEDENIPDDEPQADDDDIDQPLHQPSDKPPHPRVHQSIQQGSSR
jgi:hypothetical protein